MAKLIDVLFVLGWVMLGVLLVFVFASVMTKIMELALGQPTGTREFFMNLTIVASSGITGFIMSAWRRKKESKKMNCA